MPRLSFLIVSATIFERRTALQFGCSKDRVLVVINCKPESLIHQISSYCFLIPSCNLIPTTTQHTHTYLDGSRYLKKVCTKIQKAQRIPRSKLRLLHRPRASSCVSVQFQPLQYCATYPGCGSSPCHPIDPPSPLPPPLPPPKMHPTSLPTHVASRPFLSCPPLVNTSPN